MALKSLTVPHPKIYGDTKKPSNLIPGHSRKSCVHTAPHQYPPLALQNEINIFLKHLESIQPVSVITSVDRGLACSRSKGIDPI